MASECDIGGRQPHPCSSGRSLRDADVAKKATTGRRTPGRGNVHPPRGSATRKAGPRPLNSTKQIQVYRTAGILLTVAVLILFTVVLSMVHVVSRSRRAIAFKEDRFRELFGSMSSGVVVYDALTDGTDFVIRDLNQSMEKIGKIRKEEVMAGASCVFSRVCWRWAPDVFIRVWRTGTPERKTHRCTGTAAFPSGLEYVYKLPSGEIGAVCDDGTTQEGERPSTKRGEEREISKTCGKLRGDGPQGKLPSSIRRPVRC